MPTNLLIYELSQAGMRNREIISLFPDIFGASRLRQDKDPVYVRVNTIIKTVETAATRAYPIQPKWDWNRLWGRKAIKST